MRAQIKTDYVRDVIEKAKPVLDSIEKGRDAGAAFGDWVTTNPSSTRQLYRGVPDSDVEERKAKD